MTGSAVGEGLILKNLYSVKKFKKAVDGEILAIAQSTAAVPEPPKINVLPKGVEISDQVLVLPEPPKYLTNWLLWYSFRFFSDNSNLKDGDWVNAGDVLYSFNGHKIYSPVSGVVVWAFLTLEKTYSSTGDYITILLPKGEVPAVRAENLYSEFYDGIARNRNVQKTFKELRDNSRMPDKWKNDAYNKKDIADFIIKICNETPATYQYVSARHAAHIESVLRIMESNGTLKERAPDLHDLDKGLYDLAKKEYENSSYHNAKAYIDKSLSFNPSNEEAKLLREKVTEKLRGEY